MARRKSKGLGEWSFILGVLLAIVTGLFSTLLPAGTAALALLILGLLVGFLNITGKESVAFLVASIALLAIGAAGLGKLPLVGVYLGPIFDNVSVFVAPAVVIVSLKALWDLAKT